MAVIDKTDLMIGMKAVCDGFGINQDQFYMFLGLGLPMRKINGRWYGHRANINDFFRKVTIGKPVEVDGGRIKELAGNGE